MPRKGQSAASTDKISIYIPQNKAHLNVIERLRKLAEKKDRSINYLVVQAIIEYLEREEKKEKK
ncbi:MAG TPA: ribbon-helix-helix protein, CopG family [Candidatus Acetothermia bacterium]|nr:ribbon-helix-helix protein, CopG family [Candidatus Acetothermia bacterium]